MANDVLDVTSDDEPVLPEKDTLELRVEKLEAMMESIQFYLEALVKSMRRW